jgi:hypothetical protein
VSAPRTIVYHAVALNPAGKIEQVIVTRRDGKQVSQQWTGVIYQSQREANTHLARINAASWARQKEEHAADLVSGVRA